MAAFADYMARVSASMIHAALANAAEKAAAAHQQQQGRDMGAPVAGGAGTACASSSLLPFFPLPLLALPPVVGQMHPQQQQQQNGTTAKGTDNVKMEEQRQQHNLGANATQQLANGKTTTTAKANRNGAGGGKTVMTTTALNNNGGGKQQQSEGEKPKPNKTQNDGPKKRKRPCPSAPITEELPKPQQQQQLTVKTEHQSSESPLSTSRISSPDSVHRSGSGRGARKLKLYVAEEKVDIIDYAKCIGNRAAGREFNVAESSIREWRKNEEKIRRQAESTLGCTQHFEQSQPDILAWIDEALVKTMVGEKGEQCTTTTAMDWYAIAAKARQLWTEKAHSTDHLDGSEMKVTMGWVSRFMRRNEHRVPKIAPPIIATGNATSSNSAATSCCSASTNGGSTARGSTGTAGLTMVKSTPLPVDTSDKKSEGMTRTKAARPKRMSRATAAGGVTPTEERPPQKRAKTTTTTAPNGPSKTNGTAQPRGTKGTSESGEDKMATQPTATDTATAATTPEQQLQTNAVPTSSARRRKCLKPMRVDANCATLLTTSSPTGIDQRMRECRDKVI